MMNMKLYFSNLEDPRQKSKTQHDLLEIIAMTIIAVAGDCDGWDEIEDYCTENEEWLRKKVGLKLEYGIPSADTFARVWSKLDSKEFKKSFMQWAGSIRKKIKGEVLSIDGKTSRGSEDEEHSAIHMVSAWLHDQKIVLGQIAVQEKTNEITAVPDLVNMLEIADYIVTADAMSCQVKRMLALCVNAKCVGEILNFFSALLTVFFLPILPCNTFVTHAVAMHL